MIRNERQEWREMFEKGEERERKVDRKGRRGNIMTEDK